MANHLSPAGGRAARDARFLSHCARKCQSKQVLVEPHRLARHRVSAFFNLSVPAISLYGIINFETVVPGS